LEDHSVKKRIVAEKKGGALRRMKKAAALVEADFAFLRRALAQARLAAEKGNGPFGAVIVRDGIVLAETGNRVSSGPDITAHAEIVALRKACAKVSALHLTGATMYASTEPCPMCFAAIHWADIRRIVFSAGIADAKKAGFRELPLSNVFLAQSAGLKNLTIHGLILRNEGRAVFDDFLKRAEPLRY
jgi:tRNA(Arg) A34 adenosine deaminase TadA